MRILIIEDKPCHIEAAKRQLAEHELTICASYDEAEKKFTGSGHWYDKKAIFPFDVVLTDLFLTPSPIGTITVVQNGQNESDVISEYTPEAIKEFGNEVPYGLAFVLAAMRRGVPVAIVSDLSHHSHPMSWALDLIGFSDKAKITMGTSVLSSSTTMKSENGERVKDWGKALDKLIS